ncbi:MAG: terminase family protein [Clostridiales bacterium]|jgi:phage terminase large subunit-like protein|nr:terminase family protein [Clostridiales bacterium]
MTYKDALAAVTAERLRRGDGAQSKEAIRLASYNGGPLVHAKQLAFHRCAARERWVFGGNRSGKTECGAVETVWLALGRHPYRPNKKEVSGWVVSLSREVSRDVAQSKLLQYLPPESIEDVVMVEGSKARFGRGVIDYILVRSAGGGVSRIAFKSCDQGREKFQGMSLDFVWFDEEPPKDVYDECRMRVLDRCGLVFGTMTPLKGRTFLYDDVYLNRKNDGELWSITMEWADNPYLDAGELERYRRSMSAEELSVREHGKFTAYAGLVYPEFDVDVHVVQPFSVPESWQSWISIDPGLNNPLSCHWYAEDGEGNVYVVAEHYEAGRDLAHHAREIDRISGLVGWHRRKDGKLEALIDSAATARTLNGERSVAELLGEHGIAVNAKVVKDVPAGIQRVKRYLQPQSERRLYVFAACRHMISEFLGYVWDAGDVPKKRDDHAMDELRYYLMSRDWRLEPERAAPTDIQRDRKRTGRFWRREGST